MSQASDNSSSGQVRADLLSPRELAQLGDLEFVARQVVQGFLMGLHRWPHHGFSAEFAEHRAYQPGDDTAHVDWRVFGRSDRYYVKEYEAETNLKAYLLLDVSASMDWSSRPDELPAKLWYAKQLTACLALILLRQGDAVGLVAFDDRIRETVAARGGRRQWTQLTRRLGGLQAGRQTVVHTILREVGARLRRPGLMVLVSDLLVDPEETRRTLQALRHRGHEVLVFHILDPGERELPAMPDAQFYDPETGEELPVRLSDVRAEYRRAVADVLAEWQKELGRHGVDYSAVSTHEGFTAALRAYIRKREQLR
ncbi:MAG: DUF58 domain-containing protein [Gemmatimonadetes bacterium]|nr:DUF58 domain-containing protein [Gemmatimonadota bacterium]